METTSSVKNLKNAIDKVLNAYADYLTAIALGEPPEIIIDDKVMDNVLKYIDKLSKLDIFEKALGKGLDYTDISEPIETNAFEARSKVIKAKINGSKSRNT